MYLIYLVVPLPGSVQGHSSVFCSIYKKQPLKCLMQKYLSFYHSANHLDSLTHSTPSYLKYGRTEQVVHVWKITGHFLKMISNLHSCRCKQMPWTDQITYFTPNVRIVFYLIYLKKKGKRSVNIRKRYIRTLDPNQKSRWIKKTVFDHKTHFCITQRKVTYKIDHIVYI